MLTPPILRHHTAVLGQQAVASRELALYLDGAFHRFNRARELRQQRISRAVDHTANG